MLSYVFVHNTLGPLYVSVGCPYSLGLTDRLGVTLGKVDSSGKRNRSRGGSQISQVGGAERYQEGNPRP